MNLFDKIEEIKSKPERIRLKYIYGAVAVSMLFVLLIWFFSLQDMFRSSSSEADSEAFSNLKKSFSPNPEKDKGPSLQNLLDENSQKIKEGLDAEAKKNEEQNKLLESGQNPDREAETKNIPPETGNTEVNNTPNNTTLPQ